MAIWKCSKAFCQSIKMIYTHKWKKPRNLHRNNHTCIWAGIVTMSVECSSNSSFFLSRSQESANWMKPLKAFLNICLTRIQSWSWTPLKQSDTIYYDFLLSFSARMKYICSCFFRLLSTRVYFRVDFPYFRKSYRFYFEITKSTIEIFHCCLEMW